MDDNPRPRSQPVAPTRAETTAETLVQLLNQVSEELATARRQRAQLLELLTGNSDQLREIHRMVSDNYRAMRRLQGHTD